MAVEVLSACNEYSMAVNTAMQLVRVSQSVPGTTQTRVSCGCSDWDMALRIRARQKLYPKPLHCREQRRQLLLRRKQPQQAARMPKQNSRPAVAVGRLAGVLAEMIERLAAICHARWMDGCMICAHQPTESVDSTAYGSRMNQRGLRLTRGQTIGVVWGSLCSVGVLDGVVPTSI